MDKIAEKLITLYETTFGGKEKGRYRIPSKLLTKMTGRRRLYEQDVLELARVMFNKGYILIDMDSFFVVMSSNTFVNYRRANEDCL